MYCIKILITVFCVINSSYVIAGNQNVKYTAIFTMCFYLANMQLIMKLCNASEVRDSHH